MTLGQDLGVERLGERGEAADVGEQDGDETPPRPVQRRARSVGAEAQRGQRRRPRRARCRADLPAPRSLLRGDDDRPRVHPPSAQRSSCSNVRVCAHPYGAETLTYEGNNSSRARGGVRTHMTRRSGGFKTSLPRPGRPGSVRSTCSRPPPLSALVRLIRPGPTGTARSCAGTVQDFALSCPTTCPTIASWPNDRSDRSHSPPTSPTPSTRPPRQKAQRSARGSRIPQPTVCGSMLVVRASPSGNASTAPSPLTSSPTGSPAPERCSADSRRARAPE